MSIERVTAGEMSDMNKETLSIPKVAAEKGAENCEELIITARQ